MPEVIKPKEELFRGVDYLQMIQATIERMSTASAIFKGFAATIVAGVSAITFKEISVVVLIFSFLPVFAFLAMDVYYLRLERRFRALYEMVRLGKRPVNYDMKAPSAKDIVTEDKSDSYRVRIYKCIFTSSILLFYLPIIMICVVIVVLKIIMLTGGACV